jgi:hypothetical protein
MSLTKLSGIILLALPLTAWGRPAGAPVQGEAMGALLTAADADVLPAAPAAPESAPAGAPASRSNFCTENLYTYRDRPVSGYELNCANASLGLLLHHSTSYDAGSLFARDGRCSPKHDSRVVLRSRELQPFEIGHETSAAGESVGRRELRLYRDGEGLEAGEFLLNLTWIQGGDSYQLGFIPETGATPDHVFKLAGGGSGSDSFVLRAAGLPFAFATAKTVNGRAIAYKNVPVDCEMTISVDSWYGR